MAPPPRLGYKGNEDNHRKKGMPSLSARVSEALRNPEKMTPGLKKYIEYLDREDQRILEERRLGLRTRPTFPPPTDEKLTARFRESIYHPKLTPFPPRPNHGNRVFDQPCALSLEFECALLGKSLPPDDELFCPMQKMVNEKLKSIRMARKGASEDVIAPAEEMQPATRGTKIPHDLPGHLEIKMLTVEDMELDFVRAYGKTKSAMMKELRGVKNDVLSSTFF